LETTRAFKINHYLIKKKERKVNEVLSFLSLVGKVRIELSSKDKIIVWYKVAQTQYELIIFKKF